MPLRFPRPVIPVIAIGMAAVWVAAASAPALADQTRQQEWWLGALNVTRSWQVQASQGTGVTVAVLSDGVAAQQPDLAGSVTPGPDLTGTGQQPGSSFFGPAGTAAASLIAGHGSGPAHGSGILGVAPRSRILSVRVTLPPADPALDAAATGAGLPGAIASGIRFAVAHHASVIDLPLDPGRPDPAAIAALPIPRFANQPPQLNGILAAAGGSAAEQQAVAFALSKGVVLVAPAGDNAQGSGAANFPAAYPGVIAVGAFGTTFSRGAFSSSQPYVTVTAPGVGVTAADALGGYTAVSSTTAASAVVSGIAALIKAQYPGLTPAQVRQALASSTVIKPPGGRAAGSGTGTVDAGRAMLAAASLAAPASSRAGARAQPLASPPAPLASPLSSNSLVPGLIRAVLVSLGVLVLLLIAVLWYARRQRRRQQDSTQATTEWARSAQNAFSAYGPGDSRTEADKMLEYFAAPSSVPASTGSPFGVGASTFTTNRGGSRTSTSESATSGLGAWAAVAPAPRAQNRQARVSGAPPWEPAAQPASELPWAAVPGPAGATGGGPGAAGAGPGSDSVWPVTWPSAAAPTASSESWEELAADRPAAAHAAPGRALTPPPAPDGPGTSDPGFGGSAADSPPVSGPATTGDDLRPGASGAGGPVANGTAGSGPRSPSGSNWEALGAGAGPEQENDALGDAAWPDGPGDDAYRPAPASGEDPWASAPVAAPWPPAESSTPWAPAEHTGPWQAGDSAGRWSPAGDDARTAQDTGPQRQAPAASPWEAGGWAPAAAESGWEPGDRPEGFPARDDEES